MNTPSKGVEGASPALERPGQRSGWHPGAHQGGTDRIHQHHIGDALAQAGQHARGTEGGDIEHLRQVAIDHVAVTGKQRMSIAPDIPTIAESGYPDFEAVGWFGLVAPAGTPRAIVDRLNAETVKAAHSPAVHERLTAIGFDVVTSTPEAFSRYIQSEIVKWRTLVKQMGIKRQ